MSVKSVLIFILLYVGFEVISALGELLIGLLNLWTALLSRSTQKIIKKLNEKIEEDEDDDEEEHVMGFQPPIEDIIIESENRRK